MNWLKKREQTLTRTIRVICFGVKEDNEYLELKKAMVATITVRN